LALPGLILYRGKTTEEEMNTEDRRAPGATRLPFDGLVEVGGALGPSFEAQAVNVSEDGMHLRTAYLPEQGQPLTCRFDAGQGQSVLVSGEVVWSQGAEKGGEFGVRFTDMDAESVDALKRICGVPSESEAKPVPSGSKVRLHIDGLASPMRAKVRDARATAVTVGSDLGFLQVGRPLELEDAQSGKKRPASIDRVEVAVDPASHVPQLIVTLRYSDVSAPVPAENATAGRGWAPAPSAASGADDLAAVEEASAKMKGALARNLTRVGPAIERLAERARTMATLLAQRRDQDRSPVRRTTAPPPGGALHATGRRVVRGDEGNPSVADATEMKAGTTKRKAMIATAVMLAAVVGAIAIKKSHHDAASDAAGPAGSGATATEAAPPAPAAAPAAPMPAEPPSPQSAGPSALAADDSDPSSRAHKKHLHVAPFGNGPVHHGNVLRLKMDSPIEAIEGAQQPTGFTVKIPGRKAVEAAAPLAARDSRIAAIKVANEGAGAELSVTFKDGVPNYQVSARGDTLVIALAPVGTLDETMAKKDEKGGKSKHAKHEKKKGEEQF
jgi:PilZ domain